jgi:hypothetical protein
MLKLLDYGKPNPFGDIIGRPRNLAWPVSAYRVTLPRPSGDGDDLNSFERVILKLLDVLGAVEDHELADETRLPLDLVRSILLRLQDKELIDGSNVVIEQERDHENSKNAKVPMFVTALVFRELVTGKHLPFVHWLGDSNPLQKKEREGDQFWSIRSDDDHKRPALTQRDVIKILRATQRRSAAFGKDDRIPLVQQVRIVPQPELHHLDCPIAIQKSDGEFRIADPFGNGFSLVLEGALEHLLEQDEKLGQWLRQWKHSLSNPRQGEPDARMKEAFDNNANRQRYPKLLASLHLARSASFHSMAQIYASIEWALFYASGRRPFEKTVAMLKFTAQAEHPALLVGAATQVGLTLPPSGFKPVREGKLRDFESGKAELATLLSIAVLQAQGDDAHPLHRIASSHPEFIIRLFGIKKKRDEKSHGKGSADAPDKELSDAPFMRDMIHALLPDMVFSGMPMIETDRNFRADALLDARASIQSEFGFKTFNRLGANLKERLVHAERFFLSCKDGDDGIGFVRELYAALQSAFEMSLVGRLPPDADDDRLIESAGRKATSAKLCSELPESLRTVRALAVRQTLQGNGQSLGACVLAFLLMSDDDSLRSLADAQPSFVSDVAGVIARRGHGNEPLPLLKADTAKLRKASYKTIKTLIEV